MPWSARRRADRTGGHLCRRSTTTASRRWTGRDARRRPRPAAPARRRALAHSVGRHPRRATGRAGWSCAAWAARRSAATWRARRSATAPRARSRSCAATRSSPGRRRTSLVLCASYSGDTEETLACFEAAGAAGAQRVVLTTGGELAELAREEGVPVIGVPAGMQPRAAVIYMTIGVIGVRGAVRCGAGAARRDRYGHRRFSNGSSRNGVRARPTIRWRSRSPAARRHHPGDPRRSATTAPVARRWKTQINENAMRRPRSATRASRGRTTTRSAAGSAAARWPRSRRLPRRPGPAPARAAPRRADGRGDRARGRPGPEVAHRGRQPSRAGALRVLLGDLVSVYMAVLAGVDPRRPPRRSRASNSSSEGDLIGGQSCLWCCYPTLSQDRA